MIKKAPHFLKLKTNTEKLRTQHQRPPLEPITKQNKPHNKKQEAISLM